MKYIGLKTTNYKGHKIKKAKVVPNYLAKELEQKGLAKPKVK